jgi:hypothetical protein
MIRRRETPAIMLVGDDSASNIQHGRMLVEGMGGGLKRGVGGVGRHDSMLMYYLSYYDFT